MIVSTEFLQYRELRPLLDKYKILVPKKRHYYIETLGAALCT